MKRSEKAVGTVLPGSKIIGGRPAGAGYVVAALVAGTAVLAHLEPAAPAAVGTAALVLVLAPLWLSARATTAWLVLLGLTLLPAAQPTALQACSTVATIVLLTFAGRRVAALGAEVGTAQASTLRQVTARDNEARASQSRQAELAQRLQHAATHDPLTGLLNRNTLTQLLDATLAIGSPAAVLVMSLTGFRQVNDRFGAAGGDEVLVAVGRRLTGAARGSDLVARLSGDEFAVLLPGVNEAEAASVSSRLLAVLDDPFAVADQAVLIRARGGRAFDDQVGAGRDLLRRAETPPAAPRSAVRWPSSRPAHRWTTGNASPRRPTCTAHSPRTRCIWCTSRWSAPRPVASSRSRPSCAGTTPSGGRCLPMSSSGWRNAPA